MVKSANYEEQKCLPKIVSLYFILWQGSMYSCMFSPSELETSCNTNFYVSTTVFITQGNT